MNKSPSPSTNSENSQQNNSLRDDSLQGDSLRINAPILEHQIWHQKRKSILSPYCDTSFLDHEGFCGFYNLERYNQLLKNVDQTKDNTWTKELGLYPVPVANLISVVVPVFNEDTTIDWVLRRLASCPIVGQIIVVNDASSDRTEEVLKRIQQSKNDSFWVDRLPEGIQVVSHPVNQGKGAALRTGFELAKLSWIAIQDADTEYDPLDLLRLVNAAITEDATVVYGSRYLSKSNQSSPLWHRIGNGVITRISNLFTGLTLTDVETCYKMIRADILQSIAPSLKEDRFGIEIELTAKLARHRLAKFNEQPISYAKRSYAEGKKIGVKDGIRALWCMLRYRIAD